MPQLDWLEAIAVAFGIVSVYLSVKQIIWSWPTAIINVALYFVIFGREQFYALMGLQVCYAAISVYGWYQWLYGGEHRSPLLVSRTPRRYAMLLPAIWAAGLAGLGLVLDRTTENPIPYVDAGLAVASLIAMWMMGRKYLEHWGVWIAVDVVSIAVFIRQDLLLTAFLYAVFLVLSARGLVEWQRSWRSRAGAG